jgi:hypothetical protein
MRSKTGAVALGISGGRLNPQITSCLLERTTLLLFTEMGDEEVPHFLSRALVSCANCHDLHI